MRCGWRSLAVLLAALVLTYGVGASAEVVQTDGLRVTVLSQIEPSKLPRVGTAPIAVFVSGHVSTPSGALPPQLREMTVYVNRHGKLQSEGLPACSLARIETSSSEDAVAACGKALVGSGRFWASVVFPDQRPYPTRGRLLVFNGRERGRPMLFAHIYTQVPFTTSFVIPFRLEKIDKGPYGTKLTARFPVALGEWGFVDRIKLTLRKKYAYRGEHLSYFNAGCPAPKGAAAATFALARATFNFDGNRSIGINVPKTCRVAR
jgi:hypothetical protein